MNEKGQPLVFISHADSDRRLAAALGRLVGRACTIAEVWYSSDGRAGGGCTPGKDQFGDIHRHLDQADYVLTLVTPNSEQRPWIYWESGIAYYKHDRSRLVPVLVGLGFDDIDLPLKHAVGVDATDGGKLCEAICKIACELKCSPEATDVRRFCKDFAKEIKHHIPQRQGDVEASVLSTLATREDLKGIETRFEEMLSQLVRRQPQPQPLSKDEKCVREPDPQIEDAARTAAVLGKAGVRLDPDLARALADELFHAGSHRSALAVMRSLCESGDAQPADYNNLGVLLGKSGKPKDEELAYRRAVTLDPGDTLAWYNLGFLLSDTDRKDEAEQAYLRAVHSDPKNADAWMNLVVLLTQVGRSEEVERHLRRAARANPTNAVIHNQLAYCLWERGRLDEAETEVRKALGLDASCAYAHATLGLVLFEKNDLDGGRSGYEKAMELSPDDLPLRQKFHYEYGRALARNHKPDEAREQLLAAKAVDATYVPAEQIDAELAKLDGGA